MTGHGSDWNELVELVPGGRYLICGRLVILVELNILSDLMPQAGIVGEDGNYYRIPVVGKYGDIKARFVVAEKVEENDQPEN